MKSLTIAITFSLAIIASLGCTAKPRQGAATPSGSTDSTTVVIVGAAKTADYLPLLKDKRVALFSNHTGMVGNRHTLDIMIDNGVIIQDEEGLLRGRKRR